MHIAITLPIMRRNMSFLMSTYLLLKYKGQIYHKLVSEKGLCTK